MKKTKAGFTLVELIVVIAILGILAGIAIPVYSGYIKRANQAADNTLLSAVNTAVAAATMDASNGASTILSDAALTLGANNTITGITTSAGTAVSDAFEKYYGSNNTTPLKYYYQDGNPTLKYVGGAFYPSDAIPADAYAAALQNAWAGTSYEKGGTTAIAGALSGVGSVIGNSITGGMLSGLLSAIDPESENYNESTAAALQSLGLDGMLKAMGSSDDGALAAVMYIAGETEGMSPSHAYESVNAMLSANGDTSGGTVEIAGMTLPANMVNALSAGDNSMTTNLGLAYAAATAYYNSDAYTGSAVSTPTSLSGMLGYMTTAMNDDAFKTYMTTSQAQSDLGAYVAAMGALNASGAENLSSDTLEALLNSYLGK